MNRSDLVSVIIPCFNDGKYLHDAINSIMSQTYQNFEIIIVDDGSEDRQTTEILANLSLPKTSVYHKDNGGPASARNYGIKRCSGKYILTLDADDKFAPDFVEKGLSILKTQPEIGMVTSYVKQYRGQNFSYTQLKGGGIENFLVTNYANASLLFRYQCWKDVNGYDEEIPGFEDWEFFISVTKQGWYIYSIPEYLFYHLERDGSVYKQDVENSPEIIKYLVKKHKALFQEHIVNVMYENERKKKEIRDSELMYKNSRAFKIGNLFLQPFKWLKK